MFDDLVDAVHPLHVRADGDAPLLEGLKELMVGVALERFDLAETVGNEAEFPLGDDA